MYSKTTSGIQPVSISSIFDNDKKDYKSKKNDKFNYKFKFYLEQLENEFGNFKTESGKVSYEEYTEISKNKNNNFSYEERYYRNLGEAFELIAKCLLHNEYVTTKAFDGIFYDAWRSWNNLKLFNTDEYYLKYNKNFEEYKNFLFPNVKKDSIDFEKLCEFCCSFVKLKYAYKDNKKNELLYYFDNKNYVEQLREWTDLFCLRFLKNKFVKNFKKVIYHPQFYFASIFIIGTPDLFIDEILFDFKTSFRLDEPNIKRDKDQLFAYFFLNELNHFIWNNFISDQFLLKIYKNKSKVETIKQFFIRDLININKIAFYRARFGEIEHCDLSKISKKIKQKYAKKLFKQCLKCHNLKIKDFKETLKKHIVEKSRNLLD